MSTAAMLTSRPCTISDIIVSRVSIGITRINVIQCSQQTAYQALTLSSNKLRYLVDSRNSTCEHTIRLCRHSITDQCVITIRIFKTKPTVVVIHGEKSARNV